MNNSDAAAAAWVHSDHNGQSIMADWFKQATSGAKNCHTSLTWTTFLACAQEKIMKLTSGKQSYHHHHHQGTRNCMQKLDWTISSIIIVLHCLPSCLASKLKGLARNLLELLTCCSRLKSACKSRRINTESQQIFDCYDHTQTWTVWLENEHKNFAYYLAWWK